MISEMFLTSSKTFIKDNNNNNCKASPRVMLKNLPGNYPHKDLWQIRRKMKELSSVAVIPPRLLSSKNMVQSNRDNLVPDPLLAYITDMSAVEWAEEEKELFGQLFQRHPKKFGRIAEQLPGKSRKDCVLYYYLSKKKVNYKRGKRVPGGSGNNKKLVGGKATQAFRLSQRLSSFLSSAFPSFPLPLPCRA